MNLHFRCPKIYFNTRKFFIAYTDDSVQVDVFATTFTNLARQLHHITHCGDNIWLEDSVDVSSD